MLVLLHGRGSDENDLLGLVPYLDPHFLVASVRAPRPFNSGGFTWCDLEHVGLPNNAQIVESHARLIATLDELQEHHPVDPGRVFVLGFSMGAMMAFTLALTHPQRVRGIVAHSGYLPDVPLLAYQWHSLAATAFFVAHGRFDPVVPVDFARRSWRRLTDVHADLTYHEYPVTHTICDESLHDLTAWLSVRAAQG